ncbi:hypothetical protein P8605_02120 [Streptomyces sp. T-3]|nr:hypothetical protein [Streptomyces sp. T-3]
MKVAVPLPLTKVAFDDPATREAFERARRRAVINLLVRFAVWLVLLIVAVAGPDDEAQLVRGLGSFLFMVWSFFLIGPGRAVRWYAAVGAALRSGPWQHGIAVRRPGVKVGGGTAVEVRLDEESASAGDATAKQEHRHPVLAARTWRRRRRWAADLEQAAWFVGDPERGGVLALPGGHGFLTLHRPERVG